MTLSEASHQSDIIRRQTWAEARLHSFDDGRVLYVAHEGDAGWPWKPESADLWCGDWEYLCDRTLCWRRILPNVL